MSLHGIAPTAEAAPPQTRVDHKGWWLVGLAAIFLLAFGLRWYYVVTAVVDTPVRGDAVHYYAYAWNLLHHGVFSKAPPGSLQVVPDSFRDPGYPLFLAASMAISGGNEDGWYALVLMSQAAMGALAAVMAASLARRWLSFPAAIAVGVMMAVWPHCIVANSLILTESLFAFLLAAAILTACVACERNSGSMTAIAGGLFGAASLVNAMLTPFAPLIAVWLVRRRATSWQFAVILLGCSLLLPGAWLLRNMCSLEGPSAGSRAAINVLQGSRPDFFRIYRGARIQNNPDDIAALTAMNAEQNSFAAAPAAGLAAMLKRLAGSPLTYAAWYLVQKPLLLWGWNIEIGQGDIYVFPTLNSPFERSGIWRGLAALCRALNPWILLSAVIGTIVLWRRSKPGVAGGAAGVAPAITGFLIIYVTVIYDIFQSEPRYATPFRSYEMCACVTAVAIVASWLRGHATRRGDQPS